MMKVIDRSENARDKLQEAIISNIIKNGIYQNFWSSQFLENIKMTLAKKECL